MTHIIIIIIIVMVFENNFRQILVGLLTAKLLQLQTVK